MSTRQGQRRRSPIAVNVIAVIIAVNVAAGAVYFLTRHKSGQQIKVDEVRPGEQSAEVSRALRAAGLAALENGRYDEAVKRFTDASKSSKASPDVAELIKIATELRDSFAAQVPPGQLAPPAPAPTTVVEAPKEPEKPAAPMEPVVAVKDEEKLSAAKKRELQKEREREQKEKERARRLAATPARAAKADAPEVDTPAPAAPIVLPGTLIISSTPSGLNVQIDGKLVDQTPFRVNVDPGPHDIVILRDQTSVFRRRITVTSAGVQSIDPDLTAQVAALTTPPAPKAAEPPPAPVPPAAESAKTADAKPTVQNLDPDALYVIANPALGISSISSSQLADLYYGRTTTLNGKRAEPILRSPSAGAGAAFFSRVLRANTRQFHEAWQKVELSSGAKAPPILASASDTLRAVSSRSSAVSFALGSELNGGTTTLKPVRISN